MIGRQSGVGTNEQELAVIPPVPPSTNPSTNNNPLVSPYPVAPKAGGLFAGMDPLTINTASTNDPNEAADGTPLPQARKPLRLRDWGPTNEPLRAERVEGDYATPIVYPTSGGAIFSTRDTVSFGFGLEQLSDAQRAEVVRRAMLHLLPTTPDTTAPTIVGFKYPANNAVATPFDPVDLELTAFDERGDMDKVELYADGQYVATTEVYPFQFRYTAPASAVGRTVQLTAKAFDVAGNTRTSGVLYVNVVSGAARADAPVPIGNPTLAGSPIVGETLTCISGGFLNGPQSFSYVWLRNGTPITGATGASYVPTTDDIGRLIACRMSATNSAGTADATSEALYVSPAAPTPQAAAPARVDDDNDDGHDAEGGQLHGQGGVQAVLVPQGRDLHDHAPDAEELEDDARQHGAPAGGEEDLPQVEQERLRQGQGQLVQAPEEGREGGRLGQERLPEQDHHSQGQLVH